jgi:signal transduction histidine kinase
MRTPKDFSVRQRLSVMTMAVVGGSLTLGSFGLVRLITADTNRSARTETQVRAAEVAALGLTARLPKPLPGVVGEHPILLQVIETNGVVSTASQQLLGAAPIVSTGDRVGDQGRIQNLTIGRQTSLWWVQATPVTVEGRAATVIVATSVAQSQRTLRRLISILIIGIPALTALAGVLAQRAVGRALRPVETMRSQVESLVNRSASSADSRRAGPARVDQPTTNDEVARLAGTLNQLLGRVEASAESQRRFVADASHELRGPVANIRIALEVAQAHPESADWKSLSEEVLAQDQRMSDLIDNLLRLARSDDDHAARKVETVDLASITRNAVPLNPRIPVRLLQLDETLMADDATQLRSIPANLIENAVRFGRTSVTVSLLMNGRWAELRVSDDGPGVDPADRTKIFERFVRSDEHRSRDSGGAGLGLAIVARLVHERGGDVSVTDANPGATFVVRLPLVAARH